MAFFVCVSFVFFGLLFSVVEHRIGISVYFAKDYGYVKAELRFWGILVAKARFYITDDGVFSEFFGKTKKLKISENSQKGAGRRKFFSAKSVLKAAKVSEVSAFVSGGFSDYKNTAVAFGAVNSVLGVLESAGGVKVVKTVVPSQKEVFFAEVGACIKLSVWNTLKQTAEDKICQTISRKSSKTHSKP